MKSAVAKANESRKKKWLFEILGVIAICLDIWKHPGIMNDFFCNATPTKANPPDTDFVGKSNDRVIYVQCGQ